MSDMRHEMFVFAICNTRCLETCGYLYSIENFIHQFDTRVFLFHLRNL